MSKIIFGILVLLIISGCSSQGKRVDMNIFDDLDINTNGLRDTHEETLTDLAFDKKHTSSRYYVPDVKRSVAQISDNIEDRHKIEIISDLINLNEFLLILLSETGISFTSFTDAPFIYCNISGEYTRDEIVEIVRQICAGFGFRAIIKDSVLTIEKEQEGKVLGRGVMVYRCRYVRPSQTIIESLRSLKDVIIDVQGNYIVCIAYEDDLKALLYLVTSIDFDIFKGSYVSFIVSEDSNKTVSTLKNVLSSMYARYEENIQIIGISSNVFCVVSKVYDYIRNVESLTKMMSQYVVKEKNIYVIPIRYRLSSDAEAFLRASLPEINIINDAESNSVIINGSMSDYTEVIKALNDYDKEPRQVLVRLYIIDVKSNDSLNAGTDWLIESGKFGLDKTELINPLTGGFNSFYQIDNIKAFFSFLENRFDAQIISRPYVYLKSGQSAKIRVGSEVPFITSKTSDAAVSSGIVQNVSYKEVGIIFKITASVADNNDVLFDVYVESSDVRQKAGVENNPVFLSDSLESKFVMRNRSLCLLGGIKLSNKELVKKGIPFLSQLPVLGYIFGAVSSNREEREMIIGIYPNVIECNGAANVGGNILKRVQLMEEKKNDSKDKGEGTECGKEGDK